MLSRSVTLDPQGRLQLSPLERQHLRLAPGDLVQFSVRGRQIILRNASQAAAAAARDISAPTLDAGDAASEGERT